MFQICSSAVPRAGVARAGLGGPGRTDWVRGTAGQRFPCGLHCCIVKQTAHLQPMLHGRHSVERLPRGRLGNSITPPPATV